MVRLGFVTKIDSKPKKYHPRPYDTPTNIGVKWQMDVKYVPSSCYTGQVPQKFYQYTMIDEASRERFLFPYLEQSSYSTVDFVKKAIEYFGCQPQIIQTDNGSEFTRIVKTDRMHPLDVLCRQLNITHQKIRPRTPRHNRKVERYRRRSNNIPIQVPGWLTPMEKRKQLMKA